MFKFLGAIVLIIVGSLLYSGEWVAFPAEVIRVHRESRLPYHLIVKSMLKEAKLKQK